MARKRRKSEYTPPRDRLDFIPNFVPGPVSLDQVASGSLPLAVYHHHHIMSKPVNESPRQAFNDRSPVRPQMGVSPNTQHHQPVLTQANGQRQMLPPSPQPYHLRFVSYPPASHGAIAPLATRDLAPPPHQPRPSSSMSISSMLGSEADRPPREQITATTSNSSSPYHSKPSNPVSDMSPPHLTLRPTPLDPYKPRSQTPDRMGISNLLGARSSRSGSGSVVQGPRPAEDASRATSRPVFSPFGDNSPQSQEHGRRAEESFSQERRTSIPGLLQRPNSQPQPPQPHQPQPQPRVYSSFPVEEGHTINPSEAARQAWLERSNTGSSMSARTITPQAPIVAQAPDRRTVSRQVEEGPFPAPPTQYDVRPPGFNSSVHQHQHQPLAPQTRNPNARPPSWDHHPPSSTSPDSRRQIPGQGQFRSSGSTPNGHGPASSTQSQPTEISQPRPSVPMSRQDSSQSHMERSIFGERLDKSRARLFSPFATSHVSQSLQSGLAPSEEQSRKGSDELSQHRALLGLSTEGKKGGRYSPLPQAVQGAQAQTVVPDVGIKTEHGKIFSGIGSGMGGLSATPPQGLPGLAASPFKRDDSGSRTLNEENLMRMSRSTSGIGKRARDVKKEDGKAASENDTTGRTRKKPRSSLQHSRLDDGEASSPFDLQRRGNPFAPLNAIRRRSTPIHASNGSSHQPRPRHHQAAAPPPKTFKPNMTIKIGKVVKAAAAQNPRRHLGSFLYSPSISVPELHTPVRTQLNVSIRPNLIPSFSDPFDINCTYTVRVSRSWLRHTDREAICAERFLWGSGIYTDDSDPVAAAIHFGFIKGARNQHVDSALLDQVIREQNPVIDLQNNVPSQPDDPPADRDLHITLLVLPQLEKYSATVRHGIKSRSWPEEGGSGSGSGSGGGTVGGEAASLAPHDGVSFMVLDCQWRDDGSARGQERSAAARRRRLQQQQQSCMMTMSRPEEVAVA